MSFSSCRFDDFDNLVKIASVNGRKVLGLDPYDAETDPVTDAKKE